MWRLKYINDAILDFISPILDSLDRKRFTIVLFLDLKCAFDSIDIDILLNKMNHYGFRDSSNRFFKSYFSDRYQFVNISDFNSNHKRVNIGLTQGAINSPQLFHIFINDLANFSISHGFYPTLFADDAVFQCSGSTLEDVIYKLNYFIPNLSEWLAMNRLTPNVSKTKLMLFSHVNIVDPPDVYFNNTKLEFVHNFKYLGVFIDDCLNFRHHTRYLTTKVNQVLGVVRVSAPYFNVPALKTIYYSLVYCLISQSIIIYGKTFATYVKPIKVAINKILRVILKVGRDCNNVPLMSTNAMFYALNILKFDNICTYFLLKFLRKSLFSDDNNDFSDFIPNHDHQTRNFNLILPSVRLDIQKNSAIFQAIYHFNTLPPYLKVPMSDFKFKSLFNKMILDSYQNIECFNV